MGYCLPFYPPKNPKNQNFQGKKIAGDIVITHMCTKSHNHMMYGSWVMEWDRQFFVILNGLFSFYPPNNPKNQNFEKIKTTPGDIIILHRYNINDNHVMHGSWDMERDGQNCLSFWTFFLPFYPQPKKSKFWKNKKKHLEILSFYKCIP